MNKEIKDAINKSIKALKLELARRNWDEVSPDSISIKLEYLKNPRDKADRGAELIRENASGCMRCTPRGCTDC